MKRFFTPQVAIMEGVLPYTVLALWMSWMGIYDRYQWDRAGPIVAMYGIMCLFGIYYWIQTKANVPVSRKLYAQRAWFHMVVTVVTMLCFFDPDDMAMNMAMGGGYPFVLEYWWVCSVPFLYNTSGIAKEATCGGKQRLWHYLCGILGILAASFAAGVGTHWLWESGKVFAAVFLCGAHALLFMLFHIAAISVRRGYVFRIRVNTKQYYAMTFILAVFFPITGLALSQWGRGGSGFSSWAIYLIALVNGVLLVLPAKGSARRRLPLFFLRSAGYSYVLYFLVVLLPLTKVALFWLIAGVGIYLFVPLMATLWQGRALYWDYRYLVGQYRQWVVVFVFAAGLCVIPCTWFAVIRGDRDNVRQAAAYLDYRPDGEYGRVDLPKLERSLAQEREEMPLLAEIYLDYVFDGNHSYERFRQFRNVFFDGFGGPLDLAFDWQRSAGLGNLEEPSEWPSSVMLQEVASNTVYDPQMDAFRTQVDLVLLCGRSWEEEYHTSFHIPEGAYISDYYLYVGDEKRMGLLAAGAAAGSVYGRIVSRSQDPGILRYIGPDRLELRVFPFGPGEERRTGFEIIHRQPLEFEIDGKMVMAQGGPPTVTRVPGAAFLDPGTIASFPAGSRGSEYHFIIDSSKDSDTAALKARVTGYVKGNGITGANVYFTSYYTERLPLGRISEGGFQGEGGFNLSLALQQILNDTPDFELPVIVVVSDNMEQAVLPAVSINTRFPAVEWYYALNPDGSLTPYSFAGHAPGEPILKPISVEAVWWEGIAVKNDGEGQVVLLETGADPDTQVLCGQYEQAVLLRAEDLRRNRDGGTATPESVYQSFEAHVLAQLTAFIVVETPEQQQELLELQERVLSGPSGSVVPAWETSELDRFPPMDAPPPPSGPELAVPLLWALAVLLLGVLPGVWMFRKKVP